MIIHQWEQFKIAKEKRFKIKYMMISYENKIVTSGGSFSPILEFDSDRVVFSGLIEERDEFEKDRVIYYSEYEDEVKVRRFLKFM